MLVFAIALLLIAAVVELTLGARLLLLARITRGVPETYIGLSFFIDAFAQIAGAVAGKMDGTAYAVTMAFSIGLTLFSTGALLVAVVRLFEQHRPWMMTVARLLILGVLAAQCFVFVVYGAEWPERFIAGRWVNRSFSAVTLIWATYASLRARRACLRQMRLGLSSPLDAARFLLWAVASSAFLLVIVLLFARDILGMPPAVTMVAHPLLAVTCVSAVWLTFFPPRWLERRLVTDS
ncbi:MAG: hypothetical protein AAF654_05085 [Myxococcota bacterium]